MILRRPGDPPGREGIVVRSTPFRVGRAPDSDHRVLRRDVARHRAEFRYEQGTWWLHDLGASNGCSLNGKRIAGSVPLTGGDLVQFAGATYVVEPGPAWRPFGARSTPPELPGPGPNSEAGRVVAAPARIEDHRWLPARHAASVGTRMISPLKGSDEPRP